nr:hypothetical protein [Tanacetum cinerariifolium]
MTEVLGQGGQGDDRGIGANEGDDEVSDFSTVIAQQLQDLLPTIIAQVGLRKKYRLNFKNDMLLRDK